MVFSNSCRIARDNHIAFIKSFCNNTASSDYRILGNRNTFPYNHLSPNPHMLPDVYVFVKISPPTLFIKDAMPIRCSNVDSIRQQASFANLNLRFSLHAQLRFRFRTGIDPRFIVYNNQPAHIIISEDCVFDRTIVSDDELPVSIFCLHRASLQERILSDNDIDTMKFAPKKKREI